MKTEKLGIGKSIWACCAFWLLALFGGAIPIIWNGINLFISGRGCYPGSLGYIIIQVTSTAIGAILANMAIKAITNGLADIMCIINMTVAATIYFIITTFNFILGQNSLLDGISMYLAVIVFIYGAVVVSKEHKQKLKYVDKETQTMN